MVNTSAGSIYIQSDDDWSRMRERGLTTVVDPWSSAQVMSSSSAESGLPPPTRERHRSASCMARMDEPRHAAPEEGGAACPPTWSSGTGLV